MSGVSTPPLSERMREAAAFLTDSGMRAPRAALVLGSGLSDAVELTEAVSVPYSEIPHFPVGSVDGHDGRVEFGSLAGAPVLVFRGRVHYYEGVPLQEATFPVRVARELGAKWIALTNASGAINPGFEVGDMVLLSDHLNLMGDNPLVGPNDDTVGPRFPDLSKAYSRALLHQAEAAALAAGVATRRGIYAAVSGPHYETPAEIRMLRLAGADLVGMSTVPETIVAVHAGMDVLGVSVVTDLAFPEDLQPLAHQEVVRAAAAAAPRVGALLRGVLEGESS